MDDFKIEGTIKTPDGNYFARGTVTAITQDEALRMLLKDIGRRFEIVSHDLTISYPSAIVHSWSMQAKEETVAAIQIGPE